MTSQIPNPESWVNIGELIITCTMMRAPYYGIMGPKPFYSNYISPNCFPEVLADGRAWTQGFQVPLPLSIGMV